MSIWTKIYNRINWRNYPSTDTALNESNLNKMDYAINELDNRILELHGYEERAEQFSIESENFSKDSKSYADESKEFSETSLSHANTSLDHANTSLDHANESEGFSKLSESFAHGNTGVREGENIDNSYYYYNKAKEIAEGLGGGLLPLGTVVFEDLPPLSDVANGGMYNISNDFVTTEDFKEGAGLSYAKGTNVYKTVDGKWDCLSGNNVIGVKGDAEEEFRRGNVNITAENIGLGNVDNTSDADKPISIATNNAIENAKTEVANNLGGSSGWSADTSYNVGDYCIYSNTLYRCKVANIGQNPPNEDYWELVSIASLNDNLAKTNEWLVLGYKQGKATFTLPEKWNELCVYVNHNGNVGGTLIIPRVLTDSKQFFSQMDWKNTSQNLYTYFRVNISQTSISLYDSFVDGTSDVNTAYVWVLYR